MDTDSVIDVETRAVTEPDSPVKQNGIRPSNEDVQRIAEEIRTVIELGQFTEAQQLIQRQSFLSCLSNNASDLINELSLTLNSERTYQCTIHTDCFAEILKTIALKGDPKDVFVTILEQFDEESCFVKKLILLLPPLRITLERLAESRGCWLEWALSTIQNYLDAISPLKDYPIEFHPKHAEDDPLVRNIIDAEEALLAFLGAFVDNCISEREKDALFVFALEILAKPGMYIYDDVFVSMQEFQLKLIDLIHVKFTENVDHYLRYLDELRMSNMKRNVVDLLKEDKENERIFIWERISPLHLALYYAALIREEPFLQYFPQVYENLFLFHKLLFLCVVLLQHTHNAVSRKGLRLSKVLISSMKCGCLTRSHLEYHVHELFIQSISSLSVYSEVLENRRDAIKLLLPFLNLFDDEGKYTLYVNISLVTNQANVDGEVITSFRNEWHACSKNGRWKYYQKGKYLIDLLISFCELPKLNKHYVITCKDRLLAVLNLFAMLMKVDADVKKHFDYFEKIFFSKVAKILKNERESFRSDLHSLKNNKRIKSETEDVPHDVIVKGQPLPQPKLNEKIETLEQSLLVMDMIEESLSLLYKFADRDMSNLES